MKTTYGCGHPLTTANSVKDGFKGSKQQYRCKVCSIAKQAKKRAPAVQARRQMLVTLAHQKRAAAWDYLKQGAQL